MAKEDEWKAMRVSGLLAWIHRIVMLITFPFRRFWQIVLVLLVLLVIFLAVPLLQGIKFGDIWDWYMVKMPTHEFVEAKDKTSAKFSQRWRQVKNTVGEMVPSYNLSTKEKKEEPERFVAWNVAAFRKAKYEPRKALKIETPKPQAEPVKTSEKPLLKWLTPKKKETVVAKPETAGDDMPKTITEEKIAEPNLNSEVVMNSDDDNIQKGEEVYIRSHLQDYYVIKENLDLTYLPEPEKLFAKADVLGANSLYVDNTFLFLYGIYSDAKKYDVLAARQYLTDLIGERPVYCEVVAYTNQTHAATALCFANGVFINKALVDKYFADNVALK